MKTENNVTNSAILEITEIIAPASIIAPAKPARVATIRISGHRVPVADVEKKLNEIACEVGRLKKIADELKLGKLAKSMGGTMERIVDSSVAKKLHELSRINPDAQKSKRICREIKALEMIAEGFDILGLAKREIV